MATRKHAIELALNLRSDGLVLVHPKDLADLDDPANPYSELASRCHVYVIVKRPRLTFVPGSVKVGPTRTAIDVRYVDAGMPAEATLELDGYPNADAVEVGIYPHHHLLLKRGDEIFLTLPAHTLSFVCDRVSEPRLRELEVVYVGMSFGDGTRSAKDRLQSHSTLQQVLADLNGEAPDHEALLILVELADPVIAMGIDGRTKPRPDASRNIGADFVRAEQTLTVDVQIALAEATLIRYFQPRYNDKYKARFPHPSQKVLEELYAVDFAALTMELDTDALNVRLYSATREPGCYHMASIDLHDPDVRKSFFNLLAAENGPNAHDFSGPLY